MRSGEVARRCVMKSGLPACGGAAPHDGTEGDQLTRLVDAWLAFDLARVVAYGPLAPRLRLREEGQGYSATPIAGQVQTGRHGVLVCFPLPPGRADFARFELVAAPGDYVIESLSLDGRGIADTHARVIAASANLSVDESTVLFGDPDEAPAMELDLRGLGRPQSGGTICACVRRHGVITTGVGLERTCEAIRTSVEAIDDAVLASSSAYRQKLDGIAARSHGDMEAIISANRNGFAAMNAALQASEIASREQAERMHARVLALEDAVAAQEQRSRELIDDAPVVCNENGAFWRRWWRAIKRRE